VVFVVDAMTDRDPDVHRYSVEKMFPRLGETETTDNVLKMLAARSIHHLCREGDRGS
jgi:isochorismate hydrolase